MEIHHGSSVGGHSGITNTYDKMKRSYFWRGMKNDVEEYIKCCHDCQMGDKMKTMAPTIRPIEVTSFFRIQFT